MLKCIRYILEYNGRFDISENVVSQGLFSLMVVVISMMYPCSYSLRNS